MSDQQPVIEAIHEVAANVKLVEGSVNNKFDAATTAIGGLRDEVKRLADRPIILSPASMPAAHPTKPPLSKEEKEEQMFKRLFWGLIALLFLVGAAYAAITIYPPGHGNTTTVTQPPAPVPPVHHCAWLTPKDCPPAVVTHPPVPPVNVPTTPWVPWTSLPEVPAYPTTRLDEASRCPAETNPTDIEYFTSTSTSFEEYKSWLHDKCGIDSVLADDTTYRPEWTDFSDVQQGPLTDEQKALLDQMADQVLNN